MDTFIPLTFEKLVQETTLKLATTHPDIKPEHVREVLTDAGIDDTLRDSTPPPQGRLVVQSISVSGQKLHGDLQLEPFHYHRKLGNGLWVWIGNNGTGKSTLINCMIWALTGTDAGVPKRVRPWIHEILVEFSLGDMPYTSRIIRNNESISGGIYHGYVRPDQIDLGVAEPAMLYHNRDEMREAIDVFFMQQLGFTTLRWTAHGTEKDDPDLHAHSTTWRTYANAIHIEDDSYDHLIIDPTKGYGRQDRKILEMMLGVEQSRIVAEIQVQSDFAKEAYGRARSRVTGRKSTVEDQIANLERERVSVEHQITVLSARQAPIEADTQMVNKRGQRAELLTEQNQLIEEIAALEAQEAGLERDIIDAEREKTALRENSEVEYLVNSLVVTRCPHCESSVHLEERLVKEKQDQTCYVCTQPIQRARLQGDLKTIIKERDENISSLKATLRRVRQDISERDRRLTISQQESTQLSRELESNVQQARDGFSTTYANLLVRKGQIDGQLEQLRNTLADMEAEQLEVEMAARWYTILQTAAEIADVAVYAIYEDAFEQLGTLVKLLATEFGLPDLEKVLVDEKRFVKLYQGGMQVSHNDLARSERVKFKVAFHLALMLLQARKNLGKHPGFLIIDTPGTAEVDEADFVAMTQDLVHIHEQYGQQVQIIMATARQEALAHLPQGVVETAIDRTFF